MPPFQPAQAAAWMAAAVQGVSGRLVVAVNRTGRCLIAKVASPEFWWVPTRKKRTASRRELNAASYYRG